MSTQSLAMNPIPGTSVPTFCTNTAQESGEYNAFFVYIADILSEGKLVQVKPIATSNHESIRSAREIIEKDLVAEIIKTAEGILFRTHENKCKAISDSAIIQLVTKDDLIELGPVKEKIGYSNEEYRPILSLYAHYIKLIVESSERQQQSRDALNVRS